MNSNVFDATLTIMAKSVNLNLSFLNSVSSSVNILESSIQYPLLECMERRYHFNEIKLEYDHPVFKSKRCDLFWVQNDVSCLMEMKYKKKSIKDEDILTDLIRQYFTLDKGYKAYFLLCSKYTEQTLPSIPPSDVKNVLNKTITNNNSKPVHYHHSFDKLLSEETDNPVRNIRLSRVKNGKYEYDDTYKHLTLKYEFRNSEKKFPKDIVFNTRLVCQILPTDNAILSHRVEIWEIIKA